MKNFTKSCTLLFSFLLLSTGMIQAQCTDFSDGPYTDFDGTFGPAPCIANCADGPNTLTAFQVYTNESYILTGLQPGAEYQVGICEGYSASNWEAELSVVEYDAATFTGVEGSLMGNAAGCELVFTVPTTYTEPVDVLVIVADANNCGGVTEAIDNGFLSFGCSTPEGSGQQACVSCEDASLGNASLSTHTVCDGDALSLLIDGGTVPNVPESGFSWLITEVDISGSTDTSVLNTAPGFAPSGSIDTEILFTASDFLEPGTYYATPYVFGGAIDGDLDPACVTVGTSLVFDILTPDNPDCGAIACEEASAGTGVVSSATVFCGEETSLTSTDALVPTQGDFFGFVWAVSAIDISGTTDTSALSANVLGFFNVDELDITFTNTPALSGLEYGTYYFTPIVFGNFGTGFEPTCTTVGQSIEVTLLATDAEGAECTSAVDNDVCESADDISILFTAGSTETQVAGPYDNTLATATDGVEADCFFELSEGTPTGVENSIWFSFVGDGTDYAITTNLCEGVENYAGDTQIGVFTGTCGNLTQVACNEDIDAANGIFEAGVFLTTEANVTYYLLVDTYAGFTGEFCLNVTNVPAVGCDSPEVSAGASSSNAEVIACNDTLSLFIDGVVIPNENPDVSGFGWVITETDISGTTDTAVLGSALGFIGFDAFETPELQVVNNPGLSGLAYGDYYFTPFVIGNFLDEGFDPNCTFVGESVFATLSNLDANGESCAIENDECANAIDISNLLGGEVDEPVVSESFTNAGATAEEELIGTCFFEVTGDGQPTGIESSVWFSFVGDGAGYFLTTFDCGVDFYLADTQIEVFTGSCGNLTSVACNEDLDAANGVFEAGLILPTESGVTYYVLVDGYAGDAGEFCLAAVKQNIIDCDSPEVSAGTGTANATTFCPNDTLVLTVNGTVIPNVGSLPGFGWAVSTVDISGSTDTSVLNSDELLGFLAFDAVVSDTVLFINDGVNIPFGNYYFTPFVIGEILDEGFDPNCTFVGTSILVNFLDATDPACGGAVCVAEAGSITTNVDGPSFTTSATGQQTDGDYVYLYVTTAPNSDVILEWSTTGIFTPTVSEVDVYGISVLGSDVATVQAATTISGVITSGACVDVSAAASALVVVDGIGTVVAGNFAITKVAPVPAVNTLTVDFSTGKVNEQVTISVYDIAGKLMNTQTTTANLGANTTNIDVTSLPAGSYILTLTNSEAVLTTHFVK